MARGHIVRKVLLVGAVLAVLAVVGAVSRDAGARESATALAPAANCTQAQKTKRLRALRAYKARMGSARRAFFRTHGTAKARKAFAKRQQAKLRALKRAAACTIQPPPGADLEATLVAPPAEGRAGAVLAYTLRVTNRGPLRAVGVFVSINASVAPLLQSGSGSSSSCVPGVLEADGYGYTCQFSSLASGDVVELRFEGWPIRTGAVVFDAMVGSDIRDLQPGNNQVSASMGVLGSCDGAYVGVCIPSPPPDLDCDEVPYTGFQVLGSDPHGFDTNADGVGCQVSASRRHRSARLALLPAQLA